MHIKKIIASASNVHRRHQMVLKAYHKSVNNKIHFLVDLDGIWIGCHCSHHLAYDVQDRRQKEKEDIFG